MVASVCSRNSMSGHDFQGISEPLKIETVFLGGEEGILVTLQIFFPQYNSMPVKSISRDILGLRAVDEFISSNINKFVNH